MALGTVGLQTHIWNNNLRSLAMLALYPLLILAVAWLCIFSTTFIISASGFRDVSVTHNSQSNYTEISGEIKSFEFEEALQHTLKVSNNIVFEYGIFIVGALVLWFLIAYFSHVKMIQKLAGAHSVTRKEEPELYNLLENLCVAQGMPMPQLNIIETHGRNAFASGINQDTFTITVTRGLMNSLAKDELEAVLAHELAHIMNRDVRLMMVTIVFTGMIGLALSAVWNIIRSSLRGARYSSRSRSSGGKGAGQIYLILGAVMLILLVAHVLTSSMRFFISRKREYMADASAVDMTKNPEAMMRALMRISGRDMMPKARGDIAMMYIENSKRFLGMFATHPPIDKRIEALAATNNIPVPTIKSIGPAKKEERLPHEEKPTGENPWLMNKGLPDRPQAASMNISGSGSFADNTL